MNKQHGTLVLFGGAVKAKGEGRVGGHLVLFGDESTKDLAGEFFTANTDFDTEFPGKATPYYHHGLDKTVGLKKLSERKAEIGVDDLGVWIEAQLDMRDEYAAAVYKMADEERLGWSSGTAAHLVSTLDTGEIKSWPLGPDASLTPTPCDPRNLAPTLKSFVRPLKSLVLPTLDQLRGVKSEGLSADDRRRLLNRALQKRMEADGFWGYAYVYDVFETSLVFSAGDKWYESPYSLSGFEATIGDPVEVQPITRYEPVKASPPTKSEEGDPLAGLKSFLERLRTAPDEATIAGLKSLRGDLDALLSPPSAPDLRAEFEREVAAALRLAA